MKKIFLSFVPPLLLVIPVFVFAQVRISPAIPGMTGQVTSSTPPGQFVSGFYQFALMIGGVLAFGVIVYGGVLYAASAGNPGQQSEGKEWIKSALFGLLLLVGAWLILYTINPNLVNLSSSTVAPVNILPSGGGQHAGGATPTPSANASAISDAVCLAAAGYQGANTSGGPGGGTVACAWAVNNVLTSAGVANLDTVNVQNMENALTSGRGSIVSPSAATCGDIVIQAGDHHVGICINTGCTKVISNASGNATFSWISNTSFAPSYSGGPGRIYQISH